MVNISVNICCTVACIPISIKVLPSVPFVVRVQSIMRFLLCTVSFSICPGSVEDLRLNDEYIWVCLCFQSHVCRVVQGMCRQKYIWAHLWCFSNLTNGTCVVCKIPEEFRWMVAFCYRYILRSSVKVNADCATLFPSLFYTFCRTWTFSALSCFAVSQMEWNVATVHKC